MECEETMNNYQIVTRLGLLFLASCSTATPELAHQQSAEGAGALTIASPLTGYVHTANASRFALGASGVFEREEFDMHKVVGPHGVFATHVKTQMTIGIANADAPARARPPLSKDWNVHNNSVRSYFVRSGVPEAQILAVSEMPVVMGGGLATGEPINPATAQLDYYFSMVKRKTPAGVPIEDSYAWARINADGDVVMESVYWPEIPVDVLNEAELLQSIVSDEAKHEQFLGLLPAAASDKQRQGRVVVHHTSGAWSGIFAARAAFDVPDGTRVVHYDSTGRAFRLPSEKEGAHGSIPSMVKK
jgi:hypothetical protein